ncbi:MAG: lipoyl(octanoyl) transferase LipB [Oleiphilaceae bacterium]|nr:lipoyl(octanoyl) transferase LipB [Oleiphilaceae bacterium]
MADSASSGHVRGANDGGNTPQNVELGLRELQVKMLDGLKEYEPIWRAMQTFTDTRSADTPDQLWFLQHFPVFTQGQAGKPEHLLAPGDIPVVQVDRGGQVTYHGPGQLVVYFLLDIARLGIGPRELVSRIEQAIIATLDHYGLSAEARQDAPGVYVDGAKIASLGLRIRKGRSFHGLSLNVEMDLEPFSRINPCGHAGLNMVQLADLSDDVSLEQVAGRLVATIQQLFGYQELLMEYTESP